MTKARGIGTLIAVAAFVAGASSMRPRLGHAADHKDGPAASRDPAADIADLYTFPVTRDGRRRLTLIMTVTPFAGDESRLSDAVEYAFDVRRARVPRTIAERTTVEAATRIACRLGRTEEELRCTARGPDTQVDGDGTCGARCFSTHVRIGDPSGGTNPRLSLFAGLRADPFFLELTNVRAARLRDAEIVPPGRNAFETANVIGIVVELDIEAVLGGADAGSVFAVAAETSRSTGSVPE